MVMKIRCTDCGSAKFTFNDGESSQKNFHGACCAHCKKRLGIKDLLPETKIDPIAHCLLKRQDKKPGT